MNQYVLDAGTIWIGDGTVIKGHLAVEGDCIKAVEHGRYRGRLPRIDLRNLSLSPGLIDLMVLGAFDRSILRDDPRSIAQEYLTLGVTACQFCTGTLTFENMATIAGNIRLARKDARSDAAQTLGLYLEGPFQQLDLTGASMREFALSPSSTNIERVLETTGDVLTMINVAPGLDNDVQAIRRFRHAGIKVSMAHSNAPMEKIIPCLEAGTTVLGHIWDNNYGLRGDSGVQQPTIDHVALIDDRITHIHLICDGVHVHPGLVRLVLRCRGVGAICLVTDAVVRAGRPDGPYVWDDGRTFIKKGGVGRTVEGHLSGSALLLPDHFRNFIRFTGMSPQQAIQTVTFNPAASLDLQDRLGLIAAGRTADMVAWSEDLQIKRVWRAGIESSIVSSLAEVKINLQK